MKNKRSFTLVEILVAIAVIGILAGIALGIAGAAANKSADTRTQAAFTMIVQALEQYKQKYGYYPSTGSSSYVDFHLDVVKLTDDGANSKTNMKCNICQFVDYGYLKKNGNLIITNESGVKTTSGEYEKVEPWDGHKHPFKYKYPGTYNSSSYDLLSLGPDGKFGDNTTNESNAGKGDDFANFKRKK